MEQSEMAVACSRKPGRTSELVYQAIAAAMSGHYVSFFAADEATAVKMMELLKEKANGLFVRCSCRRENGRTLEE